MNQYTNVIEVMTAVAATMTDPNKKEFYTNIKTAVNSGNPSVTHFVDSYGKTLAQIQAVLPARDSVNATTWALSIAGICRQIACFIEESNNHQDPTIIDSKDLIMTEITARIAAL